MGQHAFIPQTDTPHATSANVTSTSGEVLAANGYARYRCFKNDSQTVACWLGLGTPAVVGYGICIEPRGTYEMAYAYQNMFVGEVFSVSESSSLTMAIMEYAPNY